MKLREYRRSDVEAMVELDRVCFAEEFLFGSAAMRRFAQAKNACTLIADEGSGEMAGFVIVQNAPLQGIVMGYCVTLDVAPRYRRAGLGRQLLEAAERWAHDAGAMRMALHVHTGNVGAIGFYESNGYARVRIVPGFYGREGLDAFEYAKALL